MRLRALCALAHRIFPPKNPHLRELIGRTQAIETASGADELGSLRFPAHTGPAWAVERMRVLLLPAPPLGAAHVPVRVARFPVSCLKDTARPQTHRPTKKSAPQNRRGCPQLFSVTTANSGRLKIRNPLKGTVLFPRPRETNSVLSPTVYSPEVQSGKN